jgi:hypothetical protein
LCGELAFGGDEGGHAFGRAQGAGEFLACFAMPQVLAVAIINKPSTQLLHVG